MLELTNGEFERLCVFIKKNYGIDLFKKKTLIESRLNSLINNHAYDSYTHLIDDILNNKSSKVTTVLLNKLTTNHTYFMREKDHFDYLTQVVMPYLKTAIKDKDLRIWCAGCSSGEEAYTLAILIAEALGTEKNNWERTLLATDISLNVLGKAKQGIYSAESLINMPEEWVKKYFIKIDPFYYRVCDEIKSQVVFRQINLMDPFQFKKQFDVIFCRNVMIYFDTPTKNKLVNDYYTVTKSGGYLFIGHSETVAKQDTKYTYIKPAVYRKV
ncbi:MAG: protein-glutamate O-methyltransferase CheR [Oscillospiraceae bacterium]